MRSILGSKSLRQSNFECRVRVFWRLYRRHHGKQRLLGNARLTAGVRTMKVSCIMPTANRRRFVPSAIRYFVTQDYADKELVILDDGEDAIADLVPYDARIRYIRETPPRLIAAKRNR